jgi:hypothetical protein
MALATPTVSRPGMHRAELLNCCQLETDFAYGVFLAEVAGGSCDGSVDVELLEETEGVIE